MYKNPSMARDFVHAESGRVQNSDPFFLKPDFCTRRVQKSGFKKTRPEFCTQPFSACTKFGSYYFMPRILYTATLGVYKNPIYKNTTYQKARVFGLLKTWRVQVSDL